MGAGDRAIAAILVGVLVVGLLTSAVPPAAGDDGSEFDLPRVMAEFWASQAGEDLIAEYADDALAGGDRSGRRLRVLHWGALRPDPSRRARHREGAARRVGRRPTR